MARKLHLLQAWGLPGGAGAFTPSMAAAVRTVPRLPGGEPQEPLAVAATPQAGALASVQAAPAVAPREVALGDVGSTPLPHAPAQIAVGGHRGYGQNQWADGAQQVTGSVRENTLQSFQLAAASGASFIEFDVQVTRDGVPVIWHDDHVVLRTPAGELSRREVAQLDVGEFKEVRGGQLLRPTVDGGLAAWRCDAEQELPMLDEVFRHVPESVGFDIEVKMTTPDDAPATDPAEVSRVVSAILAEVREWEGLSYRRIVYSTFDPDVALALKRRQASVPVLFLSDGERGHADSRRNGLDVAVDFAAREGLDGVVLESAALGGQPALVAEARRRGLHVLTYGTANDDPAWVRAQQGWGVHAAIVDDVSRVVRGLAC